LPTRTAPAASSLVDLAARVGLRANLVMIDLGQPGAENVAVTQFTIDEPFAAIDRDIDGTEKPYLTPYELKCLTLRRGNLTEEERKEIESHVSHSYDFLVQIPWTRELRGVPEIAHGHHEKLNGTGYPRHLKEEEIILQAKIMCVCDIFDALTATDRPYKKAAPLEKAIQILKFEVKDQHLDPDLVDIFIKKKVYRAVEQFREAEYAEPAS